MPELKFISSYINIHSQLQVVKRSNCLENWEKSYAVSHYELLNEGHYLEVGVLIPRPSS